MNEKIKKKIAVFVLVVLLVILIGVIGIVIHHHMNSDNGTTKKKDEVIYNESPGIIDDKNINDILFTDIECEIKDGQTIISYVITNNTDSEIVLNDYKLIFKDDQGDILGIVYGNLITTIESKMSLNMENSTTLDLTEAKEMELELS